MLTALKHNCSTVHALRCLHLSAQLQLFPRQEQPPFQAVTVGKQLRKAKGCPPVLLLPGKLLGEEMLGNCSSPSVCQLCPKGQSQHSSSRALQGQTLHFQKSPLTDPPAERGNSKQKPTEPFSPWWKYLWGVGGGRFCSHL